jgi:KDO2-lipid IV(A) lauroyltransferase
VSRRTLRHAAEYALFRAASAVLLGLPEGVALRAGAALGWFAGAVLRIRRGVVDGNLRRAFPDRPASWRGRVARASYVHLGREAVAMLRMAGLDREGVVARTDVEGLDAVRATLAEGRGLVVVTGHLGSWEVGGAALSARGVPVVAVAKPMANRRFDADLIATRERLGMEVVDTGAAPKRVLRALAQGRVVALVADQNAGANGLFVPFFGEVASTHRGPALFAVRSGAPVFVGTCVALPGRRHRYRVVLERVPAPATGDAERDVRRLTEAHTALLEDAVRRVPQQYFWQHKRWKTRPAPEPAPGAPV